MTTLREVTGELFQDVNCSTCKQTNLAKQLLEKDITLCESVSCEFAFNFICKYIQCILTFPLTSLVTCEG